MAKRNKEPTEVVKAKRRDTSVLEYTAEDLIAHKLQRGGILVAKPKFDQCSTDLLGLLSVKDDAAKFCRIQCKGRTLIESGRTKVDVRKEDVSDAFILSLFLETHESDVTNLFAFLGSEIRKKWKEREANGTPVYRVNVKRSDVGTTIEPYRFGDSRLKSIRRLIEDANVKGEFAALCFNGFARLNLPVLCFGQTDE